MSVPNRALAAVLVVVGVAVAACETPVSRPTFPEITFTHKPPIALDVARIEVVDTYTPPLAAPNVEHRVPNPPARSLARWAADRLKPAGASGTAVFTIVGASVVETPLEVKKGVAGAFVTEASERYDAVAEARLEIVDPGGQRRGFASARATRSRALAEDATLNERETLWHELVVALMADFDAEMAKNIRAYLSGWLR